MRKSLLCLAMAITFATPVQGKVDPHDPPPRTPTYPAPAYSEPHSTYRVPVEGGSIYVRVNGSLKGPLPPVIFIHGGPGGTFDSYLEALALQYDRAVILYDQLDTGYSDRPMNPANWRVDRFVDELEAIRKHLGITRWHVAGGSWGGTIALEYGARRYPSTASVTMMSPLISTKSWMADATVLRARLPQDVQTTLTACESKTPPEAKVCDTATAAYYKAYVRRGSPTPRQLARRAERGGAGSNSGGNGALYKAMWGTSEFRASGTLINYDGEPLLAKLNGPRTLFMTGQYDEARPETVGAFALRVPGAEFAVIPGAAHGLMSDRPAETLALLKGFLARHDGE